MIKTTLGKIAQLRDDGTSARKPGPLTKLSTADDQTCFAHKVVIARFLKAIYPEIAAYQTAFDSLGRTYGTPNPDQPGQLRVVGNNVPAYIKELEQLNAVEVEVQAVRLPENVVEHVGLTPSDLIILEPFLDLQS